MQVGPSRSRKHVDEYCIEGNQQLFGSFQTKTMNPSQIQYRLKND